MIRINDGLTLASLISILPDRMIVACTVSCCMCIKSLKEQKHFEYMVNSTKWDENPEFAIFDSGKAMVRECPDAKDYTCIGCGELLREHT